MTLAPSYEFCCSLRKDERVILVSLIQTATGKVKEFRCAGKSTDLQLDNMIAYMDSLTDDLCGQWFQEELSPEERKKRQKEAKAKAKETKKLAATAGSVIIPPSA